MPIASTARASTLWIMLLTLASTATTYAFACATPFAALAALAATRMRARDGVLLMIAAWAASQTVGFCVLGYPRDPKTITWGMAIGMAAIASVLAARVAAGRLHGGEPVRLLGALILASVAFRLVILGWSLGLGGAAIALSPSVAANQLIRDGVALVSLSLLYRGLVALGIPAAAHRRVAAA